MVVSPITQASRAIPAAAAEIFELLARPRRHRLIDGSGTVRDVQPGTPERLSPGAKFGMEMQLGVPYKILNEVVEFDEGHRIAWRPFFGHTWRYILEPIDSENTLVTEQFDPNSAKLPLLLRLTKAGPRNQEAIERTLTNLERWARNR